MTLFEYLAVAFSVVLSLAAVRLLSGLSVAFAPERRYWPHAMWIVFALLSSPLIWWNFWSFREVSWNFFAFLLVLIVPAVIYLQAAALVPENPSLVRSLARALLHGSETPLRRARRIHQQRQSPSLSPLPLFHALLVPPLCPQQL